MITEIIQTAYETHPIGFWVLSSIIFLAIVETVFVYLLKDNKKNKSDSWALHSINFKFQAIVISIFITFAIMFLILFLDVIVVYLSEVLITILLVVVVIIYFMINTAIAKWIGNEKKSRKSKKKGD